MNIEEIVTKVVDAGLLNDEQPSLDIFDLDYFRARVASLQSAFPEAYFNHAMAVKANSIRGIMMEAQRLGLGSECASLQEAKHSITLGDHKHNLFCSLSHFQALTRQKLCLIRQ